MSLALFAVAAASAQVEPAVPYVVATAVVSGQGVRRYDTELGVISFGVLELVVLEPLEGARVGAPLEIRFCNWDERKQRCSQESWPELPPGTEIGIVGCPHVHQLPGLMYPHDVVVAVGGRAHPVIGMDACQPGWMLGGPLGQAWADWKARFVQGPRPAPSIDCTTYDVELLDGVAGVLWPAPPTCAPDA